MRRLVILPYAFVLMNWAAVVGCYYFLRRRNDMHKAVWTKSQAGGKCNHHSG